MEPLFFHRIMIRLNVKKKITLHLLKEHKPRYIISWLDVFEGTLEECLQMSGLLGKSTVYVIPLKLRTSAAPSWPLAPISKMLRRSAVRCLRLCFRLPSTFHLPRVTSFRSKKSLQKKHPEIDTKNESPAFQKKKRTICAITKGWTSSIPWCMHLCICPPGSTIQGSITLLERRETTALARRHSRSLAQYLDHMHRVTPAAPMPGPAPEMSVWQNSKAGWVGKNWDLIFHNAWWVRLLQKILEQERRRNHQSNLFSTSWKMDPKKAAFLVSVLLWRC